MLVTQVSSVTVVQQAIVELDSVGMFDDATAIVEATMTQHC